MRKRKRRRRRRRRGMAGLAWKIETGSIVTALMPLFLPITPLRPLRAHNDTLNGRPEGNGAVSSRDPCLRLLPFSKYYNEEMRVNAIVSSLSLFLSLSESIPQDIPQSIAIILPRFQNAPHVATGIPRWCSTLSLIKRETQGVNEGAETWRKMNNETYPRPFSGARLSLRRLFSSNVAVDYRAMGNVSRRLSTLVDFQAFWTTRPIIETLINPPPAPAGCRDIDAARSLIISQCISA